MAGHYPQDRCGTDEFCRIVGMSKTTFHTRYRNDPKCIKQWDMRVDALNRLTFSRAAAEREAKERAGRPVHGNHGRAKTRACPACTQQVHNRCNQCRQCGYLFRWPCTTCGKRSDAVLRACATCGTPRPVRSADTE